MPEPENPMAALFDRAADTYDNVGVAMFQPIAARLLAEVAPQPGERALDIGCGRGAVLVPLAQAVGPAGLTVGVDLSSRMAELAAAAVEAAGVTAEVRVADAQDPGLELGSFDVLTSSLVLFFLPDPLAALVVWRELLADGGRIGVSTFGPYSESWRAVDAVLSSYRPASAPDPRDPVPDSPFSSDAGVEQLMTDAGFAEVRTVTMNLPVRFESVDQWHDWSWSVGQRRMWESIPEADRPALRVEAEARIEDVRRAEGHIGFDQVVRFTLGHR